MSSVPDDRNGIDYPDNQSMIVSVPPCISQSSVPITIVFNSVPTRVTLFYKYNILLTTFKLLMDECKFRGLTMLLTLVNSNGSD